MSLISQVQNLAVRIGSEFKTLRASLGANADLTTSHKSTLVGAINEVKAVADAGGGGGSGGASINDTTPSTSTTYSSSKINTELATTVKLTGAQTIAGTKTFSSAPAVPDSSWTIAKTAGLQAALDSKTDLTSAVNAAKTAILGAGVPAALDTLDELAAALGDDANFAATVTSNLATKANAADVGDTTTNFVTTFEAALL